MNDIVPFRDGSPENGEGEAEQLVLSGELLDQTGAPVFKPKEPVLTRENLRHAIRGVEGALLGAGAVLIYMASKASEAEAELANKMGVMGLIALAIGGLAEVARRIAGRRP